MGVRLVCTRPRGTKFIHIQVLSIFEALPAPAAVSESVFERRRRHATGVHTAITNSEVWMAARILRPKVTDADRVLPPAR